MKLMNWKEEFANSVLDAFGIVFIVMAGFYVVLDYWFAPLLGVSLIIIGYILVKSIITFPEEKEN